MIWILLSPCKSFKIIFSKLWIFQKDLLFLSNISHTSQILVLQISNSKNTSHRLNTINSEQELIAKVPTFLQTLLKIQLRKLHLKRKKMTVEGSQVFNRIYLKNLKIKPARKLLDFFNPNSSKRSLKAKECSCRHHSVALISNKCQYQVKQFKRIPINKHLLIRSKRTFNSIESFSTLIINIIIAITFNKKPRRPSKKKLRLREIWSLERQDQLWRVK